MLLARWQVFCDLSPRELREGIQSAWHFFLSMSPLYVVCAEQCSLEWISWLLAFFAHMAVLVVPPCYDDGVNQLMLLSLREDAYCIFVYSPCFLLAWGMLLMVWTDLPLLHQRLYAATIASFLIHQLVSRWAEVAVERRNTVVWHQRKFSHRGAQAEEAGSE